MIEVKVDTAALSKLIDDLGKGSTMRWSRRWLKRS